MAARRTTVLGDGRVMAFSGNLADGNRSNTVEIFDIRTADVPWSAPAAAPFTPPLYPRMFLLPNGKVFFTGQGSGMRRLPVKCVMPARSNTKRRG